MNIDRKKEYADSECLLAYAQNNIDKDPQKNAYYFKTGPGEYAENEKFLGLSASALNHVIKKNPNVTLDTLHELMNCPYNEIRLLALMYLKKKYSIAIKKNHRSKQETIIAFYLQEKLNLNNWNLVDTSAPQILGHWLYYKPCDNLIWTLSQEQSQWQRRIAVVCQLYAIKKGKMDLTYALAKALMNDPEDLMHKAIGWMLRECGKQDQLRLESFLRKNSRNIPRVTLRYAIEKISEDKRLYYLNL